MPFERASGVLLHPTSLPGPAGIGDLGPAARRWLDFLALGKQQYWQVLPLGPTGTSHSPYQALSAFAGNPLLISPERLVEEGLLTAKEAGHGAAAKGASAVDYGHVGRHKEALLRRAFAGWTADPSFDAFATAQKHWLDDFALFMALRGESEGRSWTEWPKGLALREPSPLAKATETHDAEIRYQKFVQWVFFRQLGELRAEAKNRGIRLIGDIPIFVAHDSADVWSNPSLFELDAAGHPTHVAGVPPDYFSKTGQLWGNPLYRWDRIEKAGWGWWIDRLKAALAMCDVIRIDHFRGFSAYWSIPAGDKTAVNGKWVDGPGERFFTAVHEKLGDLPFIAEDLGFVTPEVEALRDGFSLPGMKILQFAFSGPDNGYVPHNYVTPNCVVYTGTHDNDTTKGWWRSAPAKEKAYLREYLGRAPKEISWDLIRMAFTSTARLAVVPLQDLCSLPSSSRMNTPGTKRGNWSWRATNRMLDPKVARRLANLTTATARSAPTNR